jgi:hypothetical protein
MKATLSLIIVFLLAVAANAAANGRNQIGEVLGQPIYREQINAPKEGCPPESLPLYMKLNALIVRPVLEKYCTTHRKELEPTEQEIKQYLAYAIREHETWIKEHGAAAKKKVAAINTKLQKESISPKERQELENDRDNIIAIELTPPDRNLAISAIKPWKIRLHFYNQRSGHTGRSL